MNTIIGIDGKPLQSPTDKRYAIVGKINVHISTFELKEGEDVGHALRTHRLMVDRHDPKLKDFTETVQLYWAEDDNTRDFARGTVLQQIIMLFTNLNSDGTCRVQMSADKLVDAILKREGGDKNVTSQPEETNGQN